MSVLIKPIITEKATLGSELLNRYTFLVHPKANKVFSGLSVVIESNPFTTLKR